MHETYVVLYISQKKSSLSICRTTQRKACPMYSSALALINHQLIFNNNRIMLREVKVKVKPPYMRPSVLNPPQDVNRCARSYHSRNSSSPVYDLNILILTLAGALELELIVTANLPLTLLLLGKTMVLFVEDIESFEAISSCFSIVDFRGG